MKILPKLAPRCSGFKIYLGSTTNAIRLDSSKLPAVFLILAKLKKIALVHAEQEKCLELHRMVESSLLDHVSAHPAVCEETAVKQILRLTKSIPAQVHICHLSSREGIKLVKNRPMNVSVGVTPHHLLFDYERVESHYTFYKVNPPIRARFDREALWKNLDAALFDVVESDHAPHTQKEKDEGFDKAPSGMPGVETMYPLLLALVKQDRLSFQRLIPLLCERPAKLLNVPKGKIEVGRDADLVVIDFKTMQPIRAEQLHSKSRWTPFEGWPAIFPEMVFLRGEKLVENHELQVKPGFGRFVETVHS
jgi:dihydroorotase